MRRKFLSVVLCVCMMFTMVPFAFATGDTESSSGSGGGSAVAQIDTTTYNTLSDAINAAENGKTITLLRNTSGQVRIPADKDITLDLNGNTITHTGTTVYNLGKLTIRDSSNDKSGKIISTGNVGVCVGHNSTTTIEYATIEAVEGAVITGYATGATITINDGKFSASDNAVIAGNGNNTDDHATDKPVRTNPNKINILGGTFIGNIKTTGYIACGIYAPWKDIITVSGGDFTVNNGIGIVARAGQVTVTGGSFTCNGTAKGKVGDKNFDMDAAQAVYFDASDPAYPAYNSETDYIKLLGGTFSSDVTNYVAENYTCIQNNDKYTVKALNEVAVAKIGDILYPTLAKAIEAVPNDGESATTVTLIKDSTEDVTIPANKKVALELNGKKLTNVSSNTITNNGTLTITGEGTVDNVTHAKAAVWNNVGGTVTINDGTYTRSAEKSTDENNSGGNSYYVIDNYGTLTINKGTFKFSDTNAGAFSSLIHNGWYDGSKNTSGKNAVMTINDGNFTQGTGGKITVKNDDYGELNLNGGVFTQPQSNFYCVYNYNIAKISGGTINGYVGNEYANATCDKGLLEISNKAVINGGIQSRTKASQTSSNDQNLIKITDNAKVAGAITSADAKYVTVSGGYFTSDPTAYLANGKGLVDSDLAGYYKVGDSTVDVDTEVKAGEPSVDVPANSGLTKADVENAAKSQATQNSLAKAASSLTSDSSIVGNKDAAKNVLLTNNIISQDSTENITVVVQPYLNVDVTEVNTTDKTMSVNISAQYNIIATTDPNNIKLPKEGENNANAVILKEKQDMSVSKPVTIKLPLPSNFDTAGDKLSIKHTKANGSVEYYTGTVTSAATGQGEDAVTTYYVTFTTNGFSPFVIYAASANVASIGDNVYPSLQAAIDAVQDNQTITLLKDTDENVTVSKAVKFTLDTTSSNFTGSITAGSRYTLTQSGNTYTVTRQSSSSSGSTSTTYDVNVNAATNGAVAADKKTASKGTTVTVTASPSKGYVVDAVKVVDKDGKDVAVTEKDGKYVFTMPASAVTVTGSFKAETPAPVALPFTDVKSGNWFYDAVKYAYAQGLMTGTSATTFAPNGTMNRAMIVTVLYRLEKSPAVTGASKFTDVPAGQWYSDAVAWAAANKIVNGYDETTFGPMNAVTREQMAAILFRYEQVKGLENVTLEENLNRFPDQNKISAYAIPALQWAVGQKIINGNADGTLDPTGTATRAQVAQIFTNLLNK